jgi:hypothetical protein
MDLPQAILNFILTTLSAVLLYFIGWVYLSSYLSLFAINVSELQLDTPTIFVYSFSPFQIVVQQYWPWIGSVVFGLFVLWVLERTFSIGATVQKRLRKRCGHKKPDEYVTLTEIRTWLWGFVKKRPFVFGLLGFLVFLMSTAFVVVPFLNWTARATATQRWEGQGAILEPILAGEMKPTMAAQSYQWHQAFQQCAERRELGIIFADQNSYYVLCRSDLDPTFGVVYEARRNAGLSSVRYVSRR